MPIKKLMKTIVIFYDNNAPYSKEKAFDGKSALEKSKEWAESLGLASFTIKSENLSQLLSYMKDICTKENAENAVFSFIDLPFLNKKLSQKVIESHLQYKAEYTFADGYPYGFAPEVLNAGTIAILEELSKTSQTGLGQSSINRDSIYNLIKTDINSFDVETVIADFDWRLLRLAFHCGKKDNFMQAKALFESASDQDFGDVEKLSEIAAKNPSCLKTVPGFYNLQISDKVSSDAIYSISLPATGFMPFEKCSSLIEKIAAFSEKAVIGLSAWGEPLYHPDFTKIVEKILSYQGLSVFIETDGLVVTEELCEKLAEIEKNAKPRTNEWQKIMIAVTLDAASEVTYQLIHKNSQSGDFSKAVKAVSLLQNAIPGSVYPQFVRMNQNENELEAFYRYWNEKNNPSGGNLIIQKYDDFAGLLPPCKPADLSPLDRDPCWHLRRDLTILSNGQVPQCRACMLCASQSNAFTQPLEEVWRLNDQLLINHINSKYCEKCEKCDEWYTFNF